ncbi:insulinase family protein [Rhodobacterales bacterium HKCCA1058]|nr:insulinase family protein [Rhodobacterales bacterium HKCCA1058]
MHFVKHISAALFAVISLVTPLRAEIQIQPVLSPNGHSAWLVEDHSIPFVALDIRFEGGTNLDEPGKRGATYMMTGLLEEGAGDLTAQGFAEAVQGLAAEFSFSSYRDTVAISARMLTENRDAAAALLHEALSNPRFDADAVERVRGQIQSILASQAQDPNAIAGQTFNALAFGDHPYASAEEGTPDSIASLTRDDLVMAHRNALVTSRVSIGASGDITAEELGDLIDRLLEGLPQTGPALPSMAGFSPNTRQAVIDYPSPQSVILFGMEGIAMDDPDFFPAFVLNEIIGGGFRARLMEELRVKRGLTYGVGTSLSTADWQPMWLGQFSSSNATVGQALELVDQILRDVAENGVTDEELLRAKRYMTGAYPLRFDGNGSIAGIMAGMQQSGMPIDYIANRNAFVEAVTSEDIARVAKRLLDVDKMLTVVVGQPEGLNTAP